MHNRSAQRIITLLTFLGNTGIAFLGWTSFATASVYAPAEERFDYVEHILLGLRSVTYYGKAVPEAPLV